MKRISTLFYPLIKEDYRTDLTEVLNHFKIKQSYDRLINHLRNPEKEKKTTELF